MVLHGPELSCIDTIEVILGDTDSGQSENPGAEYVLLYVLAQPHYKYTAN